MFNLNGGTVGFGTSISPLGMYASYLLMRSGSFKMAICFLILTCVYLLIMIAILCRYTINYRRALRQRKVIDQRKQGERPESALCEGQFAIPDLPALRISE